MRLDLYLVTSGHAKSRTEAKSLIEAGKVTLDGKVLKKPSFDLSEEATHTIEIKESLPYVGRGGLKLAGALDQFSVNLAGLTALDIGASTGGFTDCLLQRGAARVYAVDAGRDQLAQQLRLDPRVISIEGQNARTLTTDVIGGHPVDLIVMDVSFISATYLIPLFVSLLREGGVAVVLVKPQFEVGRANLGKHGIVKDPLAQEAALQKVITAATETGLSVLDAADSPIFGGDGNREFFVLLKKESLPGCFVDADAIHRLVSKKGKGEFSC